MDIKVIRDEFFENFPSHCTRKSYRIDIEKFTSFMSIHFEEITLIEDVERQHIIKYRNWLAEIGGRWGRPCAPKTIARKMAALSSYFDHLVESGIHQFNPVSSIKRPRREVLTPTNALSGEQVLQIFHAIDLNNASGILHNALLVTFFMTGMRKSEVLMLKRCDYKELNTYHVLEFIGKGGKVGQKLLHPHCVEAIELYLANMDSIGRKHHPQDWLFQPTRNPANPNNLNKPLNPKTINEILDFYAKKIALPFKISPHSARATFISQLLDMGTDIYKVAREVNHSSVKTTQEYDKRRKKLSDSPILDLKY